MSTPSAPTFRLSLGALLTASALLGACSSSSDGDPLPADEATGGDPVVTPGNGVPTTPDGDVTPEPGEMPAPGTSVPNGGAGETPPLPGTDVPDDGTGGTPTTVQGGLFGQVAGETASFGAVQIEQPSGSDEGSVTASFLRTNLPIPIGQAIASFVPPLDTCTVTRIEPNAGGRPDRDFDFPFELLSAGETITFTSQAGTWLTLPRREVAGFGLVYGNGDDALPQPIPTGLSVDIPGDEFPAFANVPIPDVTPLVGATPVGTPVTADTTFRWQAGSGDPSVFVDISVFSGGGFVLPEGIPDDLLDSLPEGGIPGLGGGPSTSLDCTVRDDGEFTLPAATRAELGADFSGVPSYARFGATAVQRGDTLLLVFNASSVD